MLSKVNVFNIMRVLMDETSGPFIKKVKSQKKKSEDNKQKIKT